MVSLRSFGCAAIVAAAMTTVVPISICGQETERSGQKAAGREARPDDNGSAAVPLNRIVLFNSGVGFFERGGKVTGNAELELRFKPEEINDLLKSLVLQDLGGGRVSTVTYSSRDPITKTLKTFAIDLTENPTLAQLLAQIRGERVEIEAASPVTGIIVGVERRKEKVGGDDGEVVEVEFLNLLTDEGLRSIPLTSVGRIKLADPELDAELRQALAVLALAHATDKKTVKLNFTGQGQREVRVGYIQQTPIWKTSYRLVLGEGDEADAPLLQGWAIVENTTEDDWNDVQLRLVSGRPISFIMDLYQPLYVNRPEVQPELYASLGPVVYGQDLSREHEELRERVGGLARRAPAGGIGGMGMGGMPARGRNGRFYFGAEPAAPAAAPEEANGLAITDAAADHVVGFSKLAESVASVAQAEDVGELFQYVIATPVDLPRQQSAMLPIVNASIEGEKVSIYNQSVQAKHPLNGLRLKNTTDLHLMQGPITVFDGGAYAGDAQIEDLPPGSERLISYALDLDVEVAPESKTHPQNLTSLKIAKGVLHTVHKQQRETNYTVKNSAAKPRDLLIEHPRDANWELVAPKEPAEKTRNLYRFAIEAEPGQPEDLVVKEERLIRQQFALSNLDDGSILVYLNSETAGPELKEALEEVLKRKQEIAKLATQRQQLEQQIQVISQEQERIRQNMQQLARDTDLYRRYVKKFSEQEDQVEKLRSEIQRLMEQETQKRQALDEYLANLEVA